MQVIIQCDLVAQSLRPINNSSHGSAISRNSLVSYHVFHWLAHFLKLGLKDLGVKPVSGNECEHLT